MKDHINRLTEKWKIDGKVVAMVTDNARNMTAACDKLPYVHIGCAAHTIQLTVNKAIKESNIDTTLAKVRKIAGNVNHSAANYVELKQMMMEFEEPQEKLVGRPNNIGTNIDKIDMPNLNK